MSSIFGEFIQSLEKELKKPLPGEEAQLLMAPQHRKSELELYSYDKDYRSSAILIPLYYKEGAIYTTFIKRTKDKSAHSEQISFAGGKSDPEDSSSEETAIREAEEEIGLKRKDIKILGALTELYIPVSQFKVLPFVAALDINPKFTPNSLEVAEIIEERIEILIHEKIKGIKEIIMRNGRIINAPYFDIKGHIVWGATAMILSEFITIIKKIY
jgi:8-oxo-dGTP pyrophosphatase MutT (NUDIX family)